MRRVWKVLALFYLMSCNQCGISPSVGAGELRRDRWGDPLPAHAIARLGSLRFRHPYHFFTVLASPDGRQILTLGDEGQLRCWEVPSGKLVHEITLRGVTTRLLAWMPDGKTLVTPIKTGSLGVFDFQTGKQRERLKAHDSVISALSLSRDGRLLVTAGEELNLSIWDWPARKIRHTVPSGKEPLRLLGISRDKTRVVGVSDLGIASWDTATGRMMRNSPYSRIKALAVGHKTDIVATGSDKGTVDLWSLKSLKILRQLASYPPPPQLSSGEVKSLCFSPDEATIAACLNDNSVRLLRTIDGKEVGCLPGPHGSLFRVLWLADGNTIATEETNTIRLWDARTRTELTRPLGHFDGVHALTYSPSGRHILTVGYDRTIRLWDPSMGNCLQTLKTMHDGLCAVACSPDGKTFSTGETEGGITLWERSTFRMLSSPKGHRACIRSLRFSPDGRTLLSTDLNGWIQLSEVATGKAVWRRPSRISESTYAPFSPDGKTFAFFTEQGIHFAASQAGKPLFTIRPINDSRNECGGWGGFSPDGARFLRGAEDRNIVEIWDLTKRIRERGFRLPKSGFTRGTLSPDGRLLAVTIYPDNTVSLIDIETGKFLRTFRGHTHWVNEIAFSPDGSTLVSASEDSTALVWAVVDHPTLARSLRGLTAQELGELWERLRSDDPRTAYHAVWRLAAYPKDTLPFLRERLQPVRAADPTLVRSLLRDLDSDIFARRDKASRELLALGDGVEPLLQSALAPPKLSEETRSRISAVLKTLAGSPRRRQSHYALAVLEYVHSSASCEVLRALSRGVPQSWLTAEATAGLYRTEKLVKELRRPKSR